MGTCYTAPDACSILGFAVPTAKFFQILVESHLEIPKIAESGMRLTKPWDLDELQSLLDDPDDSGITGICAFTAWDHLAEILRVFIDVDTESFEHVYVGRLLTDLVEHPEWSFGKFRELVEHQFLALGFKEFIPSLDFMVVMDD